MIRFAKMGEQAFGQSGRVGSVLKDKWRIDAKLAQGGVATVFAATHKNGSRVAVKILHPEFTRNPDVRARFLREGYAANTVGHPGVVQVLYDDVTEDGAAFIVMELLEGELLEGRRMRLGGRLPLPEVVDFGAQLLSVLESAHEKSIIHRDIKPENLWVLPDGTLKVLDFGVAQMRQALGTMDRTATGMLLGTPEFMPPEQVMGFQDQVDAQSDLWAAGATLFVLASGQNPHAAETISQFLIAAASQPARTLGAVAPWVPPPLCAVIDRALAFDKANRWRSASEMRAALETVGRSVLGAAAPSGARRAAPQRPPPEPEPEDEILEIDDVVPSAPDDDERTIAGPGVMSGLGARTAPPPSMPPDSGMGGEGPTRIGAAPLGVLAQATRGGGIDPFDVTTLASGEMLRREDLDAALPADDDEHDADERTITDLAPRGVGTDPPPGFAELGAPPRPNTALDRRPAGPPPKIPPPAPSSQGKPPPPPVPPRPARPRQPSVPDFGSIPPVPTDLGAGFDFGAPQSP
ncbi:MAG: serine/threonine protein kinase, partial [Myxococcales bacterium]|nr:serine/threonine protein kinase [Myxococcales bacterium]